MAHLGTKVTYLMRRYIKTLLYEPSTQSFDESRSGHIAGYTYVDGVAKSTHIQLMFEKRLLNLGAKSNHLGHYSIGNLSPLIKYHVIIWPPAQGYNAVIITNITPVAE